jgi:alanine racemase
MNRLGFRHDNIARTLPEIAQNPHLAIDAVYTHFATADEPEHPAFAEQRERFERVLSALPALGITPTFRHAANSAALLRDERVWYDFVRPGLLLYGIRRSRPRWRCDLPCHSIVVSFTSRAPGRAKEPDTASVPSAPLRARSR